MLRAEEVSAAADAPEVAGNAQQEVFPALGLDKAELERLRRMGGRYRDHMAKDGCSGDDRRAGGAEQALGLEWSIGFSCGKVKLDYSVTFEDVEDVPMAISRATAGLVEMDLHRHFRSEVSSAESLCFGVVANDCIWRERRHGKNLGSKDDAIWTCSVTDALDEPDSCIFVDYYTAAPDLQELRGVALPSPDPGRRRPSAGLSMTFQICPLKSSYSSRYRVVCQTLLEPSEEAYEFLLKAPETTLTAAIGGQVSEIAGRLRNFLDASPLIEQRLYQGPRSELYRKIQGHLQA